MRRTYIATILFCIALGTAACVTTNPPKPAKPGDPAHSWLNGKFNGQGGSWDLTFNMNVVNGNEVRGWQESCRLDNPSRCSGMANLEGTVSNDIATVKVYKHRVYEYVITRQPDGTLATRGVTLRRLSDS